jgi:hypothetical protein
MSGTSTRRPAYRLGGELEPAHPGGRVPDWLARFQVKGEVIGDIWRSPKGDECGRRALEVPYR